MDAVLFISWTVAVVTVTLLWVHVSAQTKVARTATNCLKIAIRLIVVQSILAYSLHRICTISMMVTLIIMAVILIIAAVVSLDSAPGDAILMTIVLPHYVLQQFILGFPDRHLVIPNPERAPANCDARSKSRYWDCIHGTSSDGDDRDCRGAFQRRIGSGDHDPGGDPRSRRRTPWHPVSGGSD